MNITQLPSLSKGEFFEIVYNATRRLPGTPTITPDMAQAVLNAYFDHIQDKLKEEAVDEKAD